MIVSQNVDDIFSDLSVMWIRDIIYTYLSNGLSVLKQQLTIVKMSEFESQ